MKLRYLFSALSAALMAVACTVEDPVSKLEGLTASNDYLTLACDDQSSATITVKGDEAWTVNNTEDWLTVTPTSGAAGQDVKVSFTATASTAARKAEVKIIMGQKTKIILVNQAAPAGVVVPPSTCKEVIDGPNKTYKVTGTVTKIANTHYGNIYINDGSVEGDGLYIYGILDKKGNANSSSNTWDVLNDPTYANSWELAVGDVVTVEGPKEVYQGTVELKNVTISNIVKSLLEVYPKEVSMTKDGGVATIVAKYKGEGIEVLPQNEWLSLANINVGADSTIIKINVAPNTEAARKGTVVIKSTIPGQASESVVEISQASGIQSVTMPYTETFAESMGNFTINDVALPEGSAYVWKHSGNANYGMKASAYVNKKSLPSESWLVSPTLDLSEQKSAQATFSICAASGASGAYDEACYGYVIEGENLTKVSFNFGEEYIGKYTWVDKKVDLTAFAGKAIKFAIVYKSTETNCPTVEVKNFCFDVKKDDVAEVFTKAKNDPVNLTNVLVTMAYGKGFFVQDSTGQVLVYLNAAHEYKIGDMVNVSGVASAYSNQAQVASPTVTLVSSGNDVKYPEPVVIDAEKAAEFSAENPGNVYAKMVVSLAADKDYEGVVKDGSTTVSINYENSLSKPEAGKTITVEGYVYGFYKKCYFYAVKAEEYKDDPGSKTPVQVTLKGAVEYIEAGKSETLVASTSSDAPIKYKSDNTDVATVDENGKITAVAAGKANITAYVEETEKFTAAEAACEVNVTPAGTITAAFTYIGKYGIKGVSASKTKDSETFTVNGYQFVLAGDGSNGCASYDGYVLFGKKGAYIQFPAIEGKTLKSVTIKTGTGASTSVQVGVYETDGSTVVAGGEVITLKTKDADFTYTLTGAKANTAYRMQVASAHNAQAQKLTLVYE